MQSILSIPSEVWWTLAAFACALLLTVLVGGILATTRWYRTRQARRRAAEPLQVVMPKPNIYGDLLGAEFIVVIPDFIG